MLGCDPAQRDTFVRTQEEVASDGFITTARSLLVQVPEGVVA